jgi:hypothetical protein
MGGNLPMANSFQTFAGLRLSGNEESGNQNR